jgi:quercetin dioxygenase-like cupin family protein
MTTFTIDTPTGNETTSWWFLDLLVTEHRAAPNMATVVMEAILPLHASPPLHVHNDLDDTMFILDGQLLVRCGDDEQLVGPGHWVSLPRGVPHTFLVVGDREARVLLVHDNESFRAFVRDVGVPAEQQTTPPTPHLPPMDELARIATSHDMTIVGPPMKVSTAAAVQ